MRSAFTDKKQTNRQTTAYEHFWETTRQVSDVYKDPDRVDDGEDKAKALLDINPEGKLLREVKDILDELHIMLNIKNKQQRVFKQFTKHITSIIAPGLALSKEIGTAKQKKVTGDGDSEDEVKVLVAAQTSQKRKARSAAEVKAERDTKWTLEFAIDLSAGLDDRIADLNNLKESAEHTEKAVSPPSHTPLWRLTATARRSPKLEAATGGSGSSSQGCRTDRGNPPTRSIYHVVHRNNYNFCTPSSMKRASKYPS
jgi:hypothetical protein